MTTIRFRKGTETIGGTFIEIETPVAKCMFDFGYTSATGVIDEASRSWRKRRAFEMVSLGLLAEADGIYQEADARRLGLKPYGDSAMDKECFFLLSHMHIDHMGALNMLAPEIPVYMSKESLQMYATLTEDNQELAHPGCIGMEPFVSVTIGDITVLPIPIDHDILGALGFLITTPNGTICYTGDYRLHGFHPEYTKGFAETCKGADVLITEGTTASFYDELDMVSLTAPEPHRTEYDLQKEMATLICETSGLLVMNCYNRNVERMHSLAGSIKAAGKTFVTDDETARLLKAFYPEDEVTVYDQILKQGQNESKTISAGYKLVSTGDMLSAPNQYVLHLGFSDIYNLCGLAHVVSVYVHFDGVPLGEYDSRYQKMHNILKQLGIDYKNLALGGHASPYDLRTVIDAIAPRVLVPIHSYKPWNVASTHCERRFLPKTDEMLVLPLEENK